MGRKKYIIGFIWYSILFIISCFILVPKFETLGITISGIFWAVPILYLLGNSKFKYMTFTESVKAAFNFKSASAKSKVPPFFIVSLLVYIVIILFCLFNFGFFKAILIFLISFVPFSIFSTRMSYKSTSAEILWSRWKNINKDGQYIRIRKAVEGDLIFLSADPVYKMGKFQGQERRAKYTTSLHNCTCPDFRKRKKPCKHMYYLAMQLGCDVDTSAANFENFINTANVPNTTPPEKALVDFRDFDPNFEKCVLYEIKGKNPDTGRQKTVLFTASSLSTLEEIHKLSGLLPPYSAPVDITAMPTERQIPYALDLGVRIPPYADRSDISSFIDTALNRSVRKKYVSPTDPKYIHYAVAHNVYLPRYADNAKCIRLLTEALPDNITEINNI